MTTSDTILISADAEGWTGIAISEDAESEARAMYTDPEGTWGSCTVYRIPADLLREDWEGDHRANILVRQEDASDLDSYIISEWSGHIDETEPICPHPDGHDWTATHDIEGGLPENPGVWGHGGGTISHEHCTRCYATRTTDTWATDPQDGSQGHTIISYGTQEEADD